MGDWRSYDEIANDYDRVWSARFEAVARQIAALMSSCTKDRLLDIGTGTGIVPATLSKVIGAPRVSIGCDLSIGMLRQAKARTPGLHVAVANAISLPFGDESFDIAAASFVLSHVRHYRQALAEAHRVLKPSGVLAVSNWASFSDPYSQAWSECLAEAITKTEVERALTEVAPCETYFSQEWSLEAALIEAGFSVLRSDALDLQFTLTVEQFVEDREINSGGRLGRHLLGAGRWAKFHASVIDTFHTRFGASVQYSRRSLIVIGRRP